MEQHFLLVAVPALGHLNPARRLARRLASIPDTRVTITTGLSAHRKLFPSSAGREAQEGLLSYIAYADGSEEGNSIFSTDFFVRLKLVGPDSLSAIVSSLAAHGRRVTCIIYTILLSWAADVATTFCIPSAPLWVQPAANFGIVYHYLHGFSDLIDAHKDDPSFPVDLPGLPSLRIRDLPCFLNPTDHVMPDFEEMFRAIDRDKPMVLVNTFDSLEPGVNVEGVELMKVGLMVDNRATGNDQVEDESGRYMEWLDSKEENSVVYVSFGSMVSISIRQREEIRGGLEESGRPYLWVVRGDADELCRPRGDNGLVVEWCRQVEVLWHRSVGCFVTHCGWNSAAESVACGVPMVLLPFQSDQRTNARLVEGVWGNGVRVEVDGEGVAEKREVARCLDLVMGEGKRGEEIRNRAKMWREEASEALRDGGSSDCNLKAFVDGIRAISMLNK